MKVETSELIFVAIPTILGSVYIMYRLFEYIVGA